MGKLTLWGIAGLGAAIAGGALISDALSNTNVGRNQISPIVRSVPGALTTTASAASNLLALASGPAQNNDLSNLLHVGERTYDVTFSGSVSSEVLSSSQIRKIGFGKESWVSVVATASGTYSTDGLASNHVLYPGVSVTLLQDEGWVPANGEQRSTPTLRSVFCIGNSGFIYCN